MPRQMTLAEFAVLVGATPRWCQNALQTLGRRFRYDSELARTLGLARLLQEERSILLRRAMRDAQRTLRGSPPTVVRQDDRQGIMALMIDVPRYLTQFAFRAARLRQDPPPRRGRPRRPPSAGGIADAEAYGLDLAALRSGLRLGHAERIEQLDANQRMLAALRGGRRPA